MYVPCKSCFYTINTDIFHIMLIRDKIKEIRIRIIKLIIHNKINYKILNIRVQLCTHMSSSMHVL